MAATDHDSNARCELRTWRHLWAVANEPASPLLGTSARVQSIPPIWDDFTIDGPNGTHRGIVTVPARMTVAEALEALYTRFFQLKVARVIVAQLIKAVASMHARSCIHADLHLGNVFLEFPKRISEIPSDTLFETLGSPVLEPVRIIGNEKEQPLPAGIPSHIVIPAWFGAKSELIKLHEASVILTDFGEAFTPLTQQRLHSNTPLSVRPSETRFALERPLSFSADIWTLESSIWTILRQWLLVDVFTSQENGWTPWGDCPRSRRHYVKTSLGIPTAKEIYWTKPANNGV